MCTWSFRAWLHLRLEAVQLGSSFTIPKGRQGCDHDALVHSHGKNYTPCCVCQAVPPMNVTHSCEQSTATTTLQLQCRCLRHMVWAFKGLNRHWGTHLTIPISSLPFLFSRFPFSFILSSPFYSSSFSPSSWGLHPLLFLCDFMSVYLYCITLRDLARLGLTLTSSWIFLHLATVV